LIPHHLQRRLLLPVPLQIILQRHPLDTLAEMAVNRLPAAMALAVPHAAMGALNTHWQQHLFHSLWAKTLWNAPMGTFLKFLHLTLATAFQCGCRRKGIKPFAAIRIYENL
jgi:ketopantoate reductase